MGAVFTILLVLAIPNMIFFYHGQTGQIKDFNTAIISTSVGNIEAAKSACAIGPYNLTDSVLPDGSLLDRDSEVSLKLSCTVGKLNRLNNVGQIPSSQSLLCPAEKLHLIAKASNNKEADEKDT
jgi:hypothetical protein